jgi:SAM-dependent methyltransferase
MPQLPDLTDPRYLDEVGWFLYHEKFRRSQFGGSYNAERLAYSRLLRDEVTRYLDTDASWLERKTVVSIGCGCTGDLAAFPAGVKIAIDPLLYIYQQLGMLVEDEAGSPTVYLSLGAENLPLLDNCADLVICRNALDHMPDPRFALEEMWRILVDGGALFVSVDIGGSPTPDEPTVFSVESLRALLQEHFEVVRLGDDYPPHSVGRVRSLRVLARRKPGVSQAIDKAKILSAYEARLDEETEKGWKTA